MSLDAQLALDLWPAPPKPDVPYWWDTYPVTAPDPMPALPADPAVLVSMVVDWLLSSPAHRLSFLGYGPECAAFLDAAARIEQAQAAALYERKGGHTMTDDEWALAETVDALLARIAELEQDVADWKAREDVWSRNADQRMHELEAKAAIADSVPWDWLRSALRTGYKGVPMDEETLDALDAFCSAHAPQGAAA